MQASVYRHPELEIGRVSAKDAKAYEAYFEEVLEAHRGMLARVVSSYEAKKPLQEELFQEISMALWRALPKFDRQSSIKTYILSIAHKRAVSHVAKHVKEPISIELEENSVPVHQCPSEKLTSEQRVEGLMRALHSLPMVDRQLVTLALEGVSYKDIAEVLGISGSNVGVKLNRAKQKLNEIMSAGDSA
nr:sigma-70 family RNA polymerase sigma factor [Aliikangiella sp. G2MR2-5]